MPVAGAPPVTDAFGAIAHPIRRRIVSDLCSGEKTVTELARPLEVSRPAVSQHLAVLKSVGLVTERRSGRSRCYRVRREGLNDIREWLDSLDAFWSERLSKLGEHLDASP